jgi:nitrate reductase gamma subunit
MPAPLLLPLTYLLGVVFLIAFVLRSVRLARLPVHLRWELAPVPHEPGRNKYGGSYFEEYEWWKHPRSRSLVSELVYMAQEIVLLRAVWEHNRKLWWFSFPFHIGLYLLTAAAGLLLLSAAAGGIGLDWTGWGVVLSVLAGAGYLLGGAGAVGLVGKRLLERDLAAYTTRESWLNLALLLVVFGTGLVALGGAGSAGEARAFVSALVRADTSLAVSPAVGVHVLSVMVFLAWLPFSRMMHFVAKYFTYHQVRWDDAPLERGGRMERELEQLLQQPVTWGAAHVGADGKKTWGEVAAGEVRQ